MRHHNNNFEDFYAAPPPPPPRIVRETERFLRFMWLRGNGITLDADSYAEIERECDLPRHRLDTIIDRLEAGGRVRTRDGCDGVSVRLITASVDAVDQQKIEAKSKLVMLPPKNVRVA